MQEIRLTDSKKRGMKVNMDQNQAFEEVRRFFEANDDEQLTVRDLVNMKSEFLSDSEEPVYSQLYMKKLFKERFDDGVVIAETEGMASAVTLRPTAHTILWNFYAQPNDSDENLKKMDNISAAAELLKSGIKCITQDMTEHVKTEDLKNLEENFNYPPQSLKFFLENLFVGKDTKLKRGCHWPKHHASHVT